MTDFVVANQQSTRQDLETGDTLTVQAGGVLDVSASAQAVRLQESANDVTIINNGTIQASGGQAEPRAIRVESTVTGPLGVELVNSGLISASNDAIQVAVGSINSGRFSINNSGSITSTGAGQAIDFSGVLGNAVGSIMNSGQITAAAQDAIRFGGKGSLVNSGTVNGGSAGAHAGSVDGVSFLADASGSVTNSAGGSISGDRHGVSVAAGANVTLINNAQATVTGRNGSGFGSDGGGTVTNFGVITGAYANIMGSDTTGPGGGPDGVRDGDGDGVDIDGVAVINNYGTIQGTGAGGTGSDGLPNRSEGIAAGGGSITNHAGGLISGAHVGIAIDNGSGGDAFFPVVIENEQGGVIRGLNGAAIIVVGSLGAQVTNYGQISSTGGVAIAFGVGADTLYLGSTSVITGFVDGGGGVNTLDYTGWTGSGVAVNLANGTADGTGGVLNMTVVNGTDQHDVLIGGSSKDILNGGGGEDDIFGGEGDDILSGGAATDNLYGGLGSNTLYGGAGNDKLVGDGLDDIMLGGDWDDQIYGQNGQDLIDGGSGNDFLRGMNGEDVIYGGGGEDTLWGEGGSDILIGSDEVGYFLGGSEDDQVYAYGGADQIDGGVGNDFLRGMDGADTIHGGTGIDWILGDAGADALYGEAGADRFVYLSAADSVSGSEDTVFDFETGVDVFDFKDAVAGQTASWAQVAAGEGLTALEIDIGNDGSVDMRILLGGGATIAADDLIFA